MSSEQDKEDMKNALEQFNNCKEDVKILMNPHFNYEQFLVPAPLSICILGKLMLIGCKSRDYDLTKRPPKDGFQHLNRPGSFKASLVQLANEGHTAFQTAHRNMDKIRLDSMDTPSVLRNTIDILYEGGPEDIEDMLPTELNILRNSVEDGKKCAIEAEQGFDKVMLITAELLEACTDAKGALEQEQVNNEISKRIAQINKEKAEAMEKANKESKEKIEKSWDMAEEEYIKALNDMPGQWSLLGMQVGENVLNAASGAVNAVTLGYGASLMAGEKVAVKLANVAAQNSKPIVQMAGEVRKIFGNMKDGGAAAAAGATSEGTNIDDYVLIMDDPLMKSCFTAMKLHTQITVLHNSYVKKVDNKTTLNQAALAAEASQSEIRQIEQNVRQCLKDVANLDDKIALAIKIKKLGRAVIDVCNDDLSEVASSINRDEQTCNDIAERIAEFEKQSSDLNKEADLALQMGQQASSKDPNIVYTQAQPQSSSSDEVERSARELAMEASKYKLDITTAVLKDNKDKYEKACVRVEESSKELSRFMAEVATLDMKSQDFEQIRKTLQHGIEAFSELRSEWSKMVQFFTMISNVIEVCVSKSVSRVTQNVEQTAARKLKGSEITQFRKNAIFKQVLHAAKMSYLVNMMSSNYVDICQKYVLSDIAGLSRLTNYNPETQADLIDNEMLKLTRNYQKAQDEIRSRVYESKREFDQTIDRRMKKMLK